MLQSFKQTVLDLGRGEAKSKARPLTVADETLDRSAAGLDRRVSERAALFWLLSDRALFIVVGMEDRDHAFRIPYESIANMTLDFDESATFLPWYLRVAIHRDDRGTITRIEPGHRPGQPLGALPPVVVEGDERVRLVRAETIPLSGFATCGRKFRGALQRRMDLAGSELVITGADAADRTWRGSSRRDLGD